jgi:tetratricopeptide (TPR) repeat protein
MLALGKELDDDACLCDALLALSDYYLETEHVKAQQPIEEAVEIARRSGDPVREGHALHRLGTLNWYKGDHPRSRDVLEAATNVFMDAGISAKTASCLHMLSLALGQLNEFGPALEAAERSVALSQEAGDRRQEATGLRRIAIAYNLQNRHAEALPFARRALALHREIGDRAEEFHALNVIGMLQAHVGEYGEAERSLRRSLKIAESVGSSIGILNAATSLILHHYLRRGEFQDCLAFVDAQLEKAIAMEDEWLTAYLQQRKGVRLIELGQYQLAQESMEYALRTMERVGSVSDELWPLTFIGLVQAHLGEHKTATENLRIAAERAREIGDEYSLGNALIFQAFNALLEGTPEKMYIGFERVKQAFRLVADEDVFRKGIGYEIAASLCLALGKIDEALEHSLKALTAMEADPSPWLLERRLFTHSRVLQALGQGPEADEYLQRAYERVMLVARNTRDEELRRGWLEKVAVNREILAACRRHGIGE